MKRVKVIFTAMVLCIAVAMPSNAYAADAEDWASLEGWLSTINGKLGYIYADTTNIYTALSVVKDTATTISTSVTNIKSSVDDMTDDLAYLPAISSTATSINTYTSGIYTRLGNLSTIKDIVDSHTTLLTTINNNINNVWADVQTIMETSGYINSGVSTISENIGNLNTNVITIGETLDNVYSEIQALNTNISKIYTILNKTAYTADAGDWAFFRVMPTTYSTGSYSVTQMVNKIMNLDTTIASAVSRAITIPDYSTTLSNIYTSVSSITIPDYSESLTTLNTNLSNISSNITKIYNILNKTAFTADNGQWAFFRVMPTTYSTGTYTVTEMANKIMNLDTSIASAVSSAISIPDYSTTLSNIYNAVCSISIPDYSETLTDLNTNLSNISSDITKIYNILNKTAFTDDSGAWAFIRVMPTTYSTGTYTVTQMANKIMALDTSIASAVSSAINIPDYSEVLSSIDENLAAIPDYTASFEALNENLQNINTSIGNIYNILRVTSFTYDGDWSYFRVMPTTWSTGDYTVASMVVKIMNLDTSIASAVSSAISIPDYTEQLEAISSTLTNIYSKINAVVFTGGDWSYIRVLPTTVSTAGYGIGELSSSIYRSYTALQTLVSNWDDIGSIYDMLRAIYEKMSIPADSADIIGDFDTDALDEEILDLKNVMSQVAPFGAITLVSAEFSVLSTVAPVDYPQFVFPFDFGGFDQTLVLDLSWLEQAKDFINFFSMFLLIYCLTIWSIKFIKE